MTTAQLDHHRGVLLAKQRELSGVLTNREDIIIEKVADPSDAVQSTGERELAIRTLDRDTILLRHVRLALRRIGDGSYGICLHCEEDILPKRLAAVPWTLYCISCQMRADNYEIAEEVFAAANT